MKDQTLATLPEAMSAVVCRGPHDYKVETWPTPLPGSGEVLLRVAFSGICASDLKCYHGAPLFWGDAERAGYCQPPVIAGHEFVGEVVALGEGAGEKHGLAIGDLAVSEQIVPCWECEYCKRGHYWMCPNGDVYGFRQHAFGAMAEYVLLPRNSINYRVPPSIPAEHAAYIEPLACAIHAVQRGQIEFGDVVVIAGAGALGLGMVAAARLKHPRLVIVLDRIERRLAAARACGADLTFNIDEVDVMSEVKKLTGGYGCDLYIEAAGHPAAVVQGIEMARPLGRYVQFSLLREPATVDWTIIGDQKELTIYGAHLSPYCYPIAIDMLAQGLLPMDQIITHRLPLTEFKAGFDLVAENQHSIKVVLQP